jgi:hypothetical protein
MIYGRVELWSFESIAMWRLVLTEEMLKKEEGAAITNLTLQRMDICQT